MTKHEALEIGGLIFFGNPMEAIPRRLLASEYLSNEDKLAWMLIKMISHHHQVSAIEASGALARLLAGPTKPDPEQVKRVLMKLRLTRWLARCGDGHEGQGLYGIYDEPASVADVLEVDSEYPSLVAQATHHEDDYVRDLAQRTLPQLLPAPRRRDI